MNRVFPILPILSRSELKLDDMQNIPDTNILDKVPTPLLAAIYATSYPFSADDDYLSLATAHNTPPVSQLWCLVHKLILSNIQAPRLSTIQAAILYCNKRVDDAHNCVVTETSSTWSLMGMVVGMAHSLGLHLECRLFGLPAWEKRLRRRLWWAIYNDDKWMSMMFGRPPYIHSSEWDVSELDDNDFTTSFRRNPCSTAAEAPFRSMTSLTTIAESVQEKL